MSVEFKGGVNFDVIPQIRDAVSRVENIFAQYGFIPQVTSARDSQHGAGSLHYIGAAVDFRSKGLPAQAKSSIYSAIRSAFPPPIWFTDYEFPGGLQEHFHIGYNPARRSAEAEIEPVPVCEGDTNIGQICMVPWQGVEMAYAQPDTHYQPDSDAPYSAYPAGTIPPSYFTLYELPADWYVYIGIALFGLVLLYAIDD